MKAQCSVVRECTFGDKVAGPAPRAHSDSRGFCAGVVRALRSQASVPSGPVLSLQDSPGLRGGRTKWHQGNSGVESKSGPRIRVGMLVLDVRC